MTREDIESVFKECVRNCIDNGYIADLDDMTADELTCEILDGNDCFEEEDRETLREVVRAWQEERAGFNVGKRTDNYGHYDRAREPQACLAKGGPGVDLGSGVVGCAICAAEMGEICRPSEQEKERERAWRASMENRRYEERQP